MIVFLEIILLTVLFVIFVQDIKERKVSLAMLLIGILLGGFIYFSTTISAVFLATIVVNLIFVGIIFTVLALYSKLKMKRKIFEVFGLGDLLFFIVLAVSLPIVSFIVVFVSSLLFSLIISFLIKKKSKIKTIPLAGLQSLFFGMVLISNKIVNSFSLYTL